MSLSNSFIRQYTPPTCTLEIVARTTPLSRGARRPVKELLRFVLRFDDPRLPESERATIQGDRQQLKALQHAVTAYVRDLLKQSPEHFNALIVSESSLPLKQLQQIAPKAPIVPSGKIFLQAADSPIAHNLFLGSLETQESGPIIQLSVLQLFDLVTALDEYAADALELPPAQNRRSASTPSTWASIAVILLLAVGLTTVAVKLFNRTPPKQVVTKTAPQSPSRNNPPQIALQTPIPTPLTPTSPLSSVEKLPLPPPSGVLVPSPSSIPSSSPIPREFRGESTLPPDTRQKITGFKGVPQVNGTQTLSGNFNSPPKPAPPLIVNPAPEQNQPSIFTPSETATSKTSITHPRHQTQRQPTVGSSSGSTVSSLPTTNLPTPLPVLTPPTNPELGIPTPNSADLGGKNIASPNPSLTPLTPKTTAFDSIPQVAEARNYFKQRWEPPAALKQSLEYSLILDTNGSIQRIIPLGQASRNYVDRTGMPLIGEHFVSPVKDGKIATIRLFLSPDGQVQTFLESVN